MPYVIYTLVEALRRALKVDLDRLTIEEEVERGALVEDWLAAAPRDDDVVYARFIDPPRECELLAARLRTGPEDRLLIAIWSLDRGQFAVEILGIPQVPRGSSGEKEIEAVFDQRRPSCGVISGWTRNDGWQG